jgi:hypothetical protein
MININYLKINECYFAKFLTLRTGEWEEFIKVKYISSDYILCSYTYGGLDPFPVWPNESRLLLNFYSIRELTEYEKSRIIRI